MKLKVVSSRMLLALVLLELCWQATSLLQIGGARIQEQARVRWVLEQRAEKLRKALNHALVHNEEIMKQNERLQHSLRSDGKRERCPTNMSAVLGASCLPKKLVECTYSKSGDPRHMASYESTKYTPGVLLEHEPGSAQELEELSRLLKRANLHADLDDQHLMMTQRSLTHFFTMYLEANDAFASKKLTSPTAIGPCRERCHFAFAKVHKTASDTLADMFFTFGEVRNLTIVLPQSGWNLGWPGPFNTKQVMSEYPEQKFGILTLHTVFDRRAFSAIMPEDTAYLGVVRHPYDQLRSYFRYFGLWKDMLQAKGTSADELPQQIQPDLLQLLYSEYLDNGLRADPSLDYTDQIHVPVKNNQAFDLGVWSSVFTVLQEPALEQELISYAVQAAHHEFDVLIVANRFRESLVMLRRVLCWSTKDILYVTKNNFKSGGSMASSQTLPADDKHLLKSQQLAAVDWAIYKSAENRLDHFIRDQGEDFARELEGFLRVSEEVEKFCSAKPSGCAIREFVDFQNNTFTVSGQHCRLLRLDILLRIKAHRSRRENIC